MGRRVARSAAGRHRDHAQTPCRCFGSRATRRVAAPIAASQAGAAIVHMHVRDSVTGKPSRDDGACGRHRRGHPVPDLLECALRVGTIARGLWQLRITATSGCLSRTASFASSGCHPGRFGGDRKIPAPAAFASSRIAGTRRCPGRSGVAASIARWHRRRGDCRPRAGVRSGTRPTVQLVCRPHPSPTRIAAGYHQHPERGAG